MENGSKRFSLLIVDDEVQMRRLLGSVFSDTGFQLVFASNGAEALDSASKTRIDAALVDLVMPGMNGRDLEQTLRKTRPNLKCLFISGYTDNVIAQQGMLAQARDPLQPYPASAA